MSTAESQLVVSRCQECLRLLRLRRNGILGLVARRPGRLGDDFYAQTIGEANRLGFAGVEFSPPSEPANVRLLDSHRTWYFGLSVSRERQRLRYPVTAGCSDRVEERARAKMLEWVRESFFEEPLAGEGLDATIFVAAFHNQGILQSELCDWMLARLGKLIGGIAPDVDAIPLKDGHGYSLVFARYLGTTD